MKSHFKVNWLNWAPVVLIVYRTGGGQGRVCARQELPRFNKMAPAWQLPAREVQHSECPGNFDLEMSEIMYVSFTRVSTGSRMDSITNWKHS